MKKLTLYIFGVLAIIISVLAVATLSYANGSKFRVPLVTTGIERIVEALKSPELENADMPTSDFSDLIGTGTSTNADNEDLGNEATSTIIEMPSEWKEFSYNGFLLPIPSNWDAVWPSIENGNATLLFQDEDGNTVASIVSPPPTTGYEGYVITKQERSISGKGWSHIAKFWHGDPEPGLGGNYLDTIFVNRLGYESDLENPYRDQGFGFQIFSQYNGDASKIFERIYQSIQASNKWQTYKSDVFMFDYPADWTVVSDAGAGHRNASFYDEFNKLSASFWCPIPTTGYEGYDMTETHRTIQIGNMQYAMDYWHGDDVDESRIDTEIIFMETMTPKEGMEGGIFGTACQLTSEKGDVTEIFERIYQSVNVK
ncbi:MAG: hypothetical protein P1P90_06150 [Patescibacteria group bacterium]|nr:hypothetical protein [Patescibacteria group bacterium]